MKNLPVLTGLPGDLLELPPIPRPTRWIVYGYNGRDRYWSLRPGDWTSEDEVMRAVNELSGLWVVAQIVKIPAANPDAEEIQGCAAR